jgi:thioredoxin reductase (NADPH)
MYNSAISEILGGIKVEKIKVKDTITGDEKELQADGVFVAIGHKPNTMQFKGIDLDKEGYVIPKDHTRTNVEGVFVGGDVHDQEYRQAITAAGLGCMAALETERWLAKQGE